MTHLYSVHEPIAPTEETALRVALLGGFSVESDGCTIPDLAWQRRSARQLTKLLAIVSDHALHREQVIDLLWPDADLDSARNSLAKALHAARRALEPGRAAREGSSFLRTRDELIVLDTERVSIDAEDFQQRAWAALRNPTVQAFEHALTSYGGVLLPEDRYEEWAADHRQHLAALHRRLLQGLAELLDREGSHLQAIECLQRALQADPANEEAHRQLMRAYRALGDTSSAVRQFELCRLALHRELAVEPEQETVALYAELAADNAAARVRTINDRVGPLVGRDDELRSLTCLLERAAAGCGNLTVVTGEAGVGKSRLVAELARDAAAAGALVLGGAVPGTVALAPFTTVLDAHARTSSADERAALARRYPALSWFTPSLTGGTPPMAAGDGRTGELHLGTEIARLLNEIAGDRTILVLLGDLDHCDGTSPTLLGPLAALARDRRWLFVGTISDESLVPGSETTQMLAALSYEQVCVRVVVEPLTADECREVSRALDPEGELGEDRLESICALAEGNPRFAEEFVREFLRRPPGANRRWNDPDPDAFPIPALVRSLLVRTLSRLGANARRLLELVASAVDKVALDELRRAATGLGLIHSDAELFETLDVLLAARVLVEQRDGYAIRHAVMAAALLEDLPRHRRTALRTALRDSVLDLRLAADMRPPAPATTSTGEAARCG